VARSTKIGGPKLPVEPEAKLLETILDDVLQTGAMPARQWLALSQFPLAPLAIPTASGREYHATQTGVDAAHRLTQQTRQKREDLRQRFTPQEFDRLSFNAIGETILNARAHVPAEAQPSDIVDETFYAALADDYSTYLNTLASQAGQDVDRHIPCHLFQSDQSVPAFDVGPVAFRPRTGWIAQFVTDPAMREYIDRVEAGTQSLEDLGRQALQPPIPRPLINALSVLRSMRGYPWIATVRIAGHGVAQSHHKATIFVDLALNAIGLRFRADDARRLIRAGQRHAFTEERLATSTAGAFLHGWSVQMPGLSSRPRALAAKMAAERPFLDAAGYLLQAYVDGRQTGRAPHLVERWANALFWTGEARREGSDFLAVVDYGCAADGLSNAGGVASEMTDFAEAALNPRGAPTPAGSVSVAEAVNTVYREGRNKLAHGEQPGLLEDMAASRATGDALLTHLFDAVTFAVADLIKRDPRVLEVAEDHAYRALEAALRRP